MSRRKINIQRELGTNPSSWMQPNNAIDDLTSSMSTVKVGFEPTDQRVYKIDLERIFPDSTQPRHLLPHDLRLAIQNKTMSPAEAIQELVGRAGKGDTVSLLVLGGQEESLVDEDEEEADVEEKSLYALARSIQEVGLRQPLNVYQVSDINQSDQIAYRIGEGERRFWAHHLLVLQGHEEFKSVKCIVDVLPEDAALIYQRQAAENAARVDLPAIARARSMQRIKEQLLLEMGTPGSQPSQRALQKAVGQQMKHFTGRAISDRMVRNYLALLNLSPEAQDLAEAGQLTEKQLRPVMRLKSDFERLMMIKQIISQQWSGRQVAQKVAKTSAEPKVSLREVSRTTVEERFEKRVMSAAKTVASLLSLPAENYDNVVSTLASRAKDAKTREVLQALQQTLGDVLEKAVNLADAQPVEVPLSAVIPPVDGLEAYLPADKFIAFKMDELSGSQIMEHLLAWHQDDVVLASRLHPFFEELETQAQILRAGETIPLPTIKATSQTADTPQYEILDGEAVYWAHELLVQRGKTQFRTMQAELVK